jgi:hypothetical protein
MGAGRFLPGTMPPAMSNNNNFVPGASLSAGIGQLSTFAPGGTTTTNAGLVAQDTSTIMPPVTNIIASAGRG